VLAALPFSEAFCGLFARRVLSVQLWEAVKASGTKTCGLNVCVLLCFPCASCSNVGLSSARGRCHFQLIWLGVAVTLQARPAFSLPRLRLCVCVPLSRFWLACCCLCSLVEAPALRLCRIRAFVASCCLSPLEAAPVVVVALACIAYCCPLAASEGCAESFAVSASIAFSARAASLL
jgi:hypothetical protein